MRRPHVYERSAPRRRREDAPGPDPIEAVRSVSRAMPALLLAAQEAGLTSLAALLDAAWAEAERIEGAAGRP